jgi:hypothetical protein
LEKPISLASKQRNPHGKNMLEMKSFVIKGIRVQDGVHEVRKAEEEEEEHGQSQT